MAVLSSYPRVSDSFKQGTHSALNFAYGIGVVRNDNVVNKVVDGTVALTDDATNYIEVDSDGVVTANQTGYTSGQIPLYTVTTTGGEITEVVDDRSFFSVATGGGGNSGFGEFGFVEIPIMITTMDIPS